MNVGQSKNCLDHPRAIPLVLGYGRGGLVGRRAFHPGGIDTFYDVVIGRTTLNIGVYIGRLGVIRRVQQLIRGATTG